MATELDIYEGAYCDYVDSRVINYIKEHKEITFIVPTVSGELPADLYFSGDNVIGIKLEDLATASFVFYPCELILVGFHDVPKVMVKQYGTDIVLMVESGAVKINDDDYYAEVMWGGGEKCAVTPILNTIYNYESYMSGAELISYPLSRHTIKNYDRIIINTVRFDENHYKHIIEQYKIKVSKYMYDREKEREGRVERLKKVKEFKSSIDRH